MTLFEIGRRSKILFVDQTSALGGAELSLFDIVRERGFTDRVLLFQLGDFEKMLRDSGADVQVSEYSKDALDVRKDSGVLNSLRAGNFLRRQVRAVRVASQGCSVLYANTPKAFIVCALAALRLRKPAIYHLRDILSADHFSFFNRQLIIRLTRLCSARVIANSRATAQAFIDAGGSHRAVSVIYNGISASDFDSALGQSADNRQSIRQSLGLVDEPVIGVFGRLAPWKGQHVALRALELLPNAHLLLVGSALFGEHEYVLRLKQLVDTSQLHSRVHFLGFRKDIAPLMQACDVVVHCSSSPEPFGRVIVEGMLSRRPVVAARAGGATEIVRDGETGLLFTPNAERELAKCVQRLLQRDTSIQQMVDAAEVDARTRFAIDTQVNEVNYVVGSVCSKGPRARRRIRTASTTETNSLTRILFVDQTAQLGGAELCMKDIVLTRMAKDRVMLLQQGPLFQLLKNAGIDVRAEPLGYSRGLTKESGWLRKSLGSVDVLRLARILAHEARDMDVICANTPKALVVGALAGFISRKPVIYHLHDILSLEHFSRSNIFTLVALTNRFVSHVIANSQASLKVLRQVGGKTPATVCYNGFDGHVYEQHVADQSLHAQRVRADLYIEQDVRLVAVFGRLAPWKGQHVAIEALKQLPSMHLLLVGEALFGEDMYKQELLEQSAAAELAGRVHFLGFRNDVAALMQAADVVVHCSTAPEPFGRVIVEAMLSKRPIVASRAGGVPEIIEHEITGLMSEPGDPNELAQCVTRLTACQEQTQQMVERAYSSAGAKFLLRDIVEQIESIAQTLTTQTPAKMDCKDAPH